MGRPVPTSLFFILILSFFSCETQKYVIDSTSNPVLREDRNEVESVVFDVNSYFYSILYDEAHLDVARSLWETQGPFYSHDPVMFQQCLRRLYSDTMETPEGMGNISVMEIIEDDLWIGTWDGGVFRFSLATGQWDVIVEPVQSLSVNTVYAISEHLDNIFLVHYNQIKIYDLGSSEVYPWASNSIPPRIRDMAFLNGESYLATAGGGVYHWDNSAWKRDIALTEAGLEINRLIPWNEGLWICSATNGLYYLDAQGIDPLSYDNPLDNITAVQFWNDFLWIGSYGEGLVQIDENQRVTGYNHSQGNWSDDWILCSLATEEYLFWGTLGGGVQFFDKAGNYGRLTLDQGLGSMDVAALSWYNGRLYTGTLGGGITIIHEAILQQQLQNS